MNTKNTRYTSIALGLFASAVALTSAPVAAEPVLDESKLDPMSIHCSQHPKYSTQREACEKGWSGGESACKTAFGGGNQVACEAAVKAKNEMGPVDQMICNHNYPHTPGSNSQEERSFRGCLEGYRNGESACEKHKENQASYDACMLGSNGHTATEGASAAPSSSSSPGTAVQQEPALGPAPRSSAQSTIQAPQTREHEPTTCSLTGVMGDIICDSMNMFGQMADASLYILGAFMKVAPLQTDPDNPIYQYWVVMRNIANIFFIFVFLVVIYSYITSLGLSNYSVKKILPRLIAAALLVNVSYYVCSVMIDLSNILGATIYDTMANLVSQPTPTQTPNTAPAADALKINISAAENTLTSSVDWKTLVAQAIIVPAGVKAFMTWGGFAALLPVLVTVVIAVATTVIALLLRQVLIILFIVISPLAFVSIALPNTKDWFDRWSRSFVPTLMLYPVIALIFAAGTIASSIIAHSVGAVGYPEKLFFMIMAMGMQIVPLLLVPKAMQLGGGMLSSFMGTSSARTTGIKRKVQDYSKRKVEEGDMRSLSRPTTPFNSGRQKRAHRTLKSQAIKGALERAEEGYILDEAAKDDAADDAIGITEEGLSSPPSKQTLNNRKVLKKARLHAKQIDAKIKQMELEGLTRDDKMNLAKDGDEAAIKDLMGRGDSGAAIELMKMSDKLPASAAREVASNLENGPLSKDPLFMDQEVKDAVRSQTVTANNFHKTVISKVVNKSDLSADQLVSMSDESLSEISLGIQAELALPPTQRTINSQSANDLLNNAATIPNLNKLDHKVGKKEMVIKDLIKLKNSGGF